MKLLLAVTIGVAFYFTAVGVAGRISILGLVGAVILTAVLLA